MSYIKKKKKKFPWKLLLLVILIGFSLYMYGFEETFGLDPETIKTFLQQDNPVEVNGDLSVYFLNVGQADAIWIKAQDENMIIDAGNNNDGDLITSFLQEQGVKKIKYVVGTHPHEDHIGGLDDIINNFQVSKIYMPDVVTTTSTFLDVLEAIEVKNKKLNIPKIGDTWSLGDAKIKVLFTGVDEQDFNSSSIILKLTYGNVKFLFTGDATSSIERELINKAIDVDVLKVAHHGSPYSTIDDFLNKVNPKYAIISVGKGNDYGHPGQSLLKKLKKKNIEIHRTDKEGTVVVTTDGKKINIHSLETNVDGG